MKRHEGGLQMSLGLASGAHVPNARSAPVLADRYFRHALTPFRVGAGRLFVEKIDG